MEKNPTLRQNLDGKLYEKSNPNLERSPEEFEQSVTQLPILNLRDSIMQVKNSQFVLGQLQFSRIFIFRQSTWDAATNIGESGNE